jgi:hypothetical protein
MTCECQRRIPGQNGSMIRDQSERNFALIGEFFVGRVLPVDAKTDQHFAKPVKVIEEEK